MDGGTALGSCAGYLVRVEGLDHELAIIENLMFDVKQKLQ